jgi:hypothetical protein
MISAFRPSNRCNIGVSNDEKRRCTFHISISSGTLRNYDRPALSHPSIASRKALGLTTRIRWNEPNSRRCESPLTMIVAFAASAHSRTRLSGSSFSTATTRSVGSTSFAKSRIAVSASRVRRGGHWNFLLSTSSISSSIGLDTNISIRPLRANASTRSGGPPKLSAEM